MDRLKIRKDKIENVAEKIILWIIVSVMFMLLVIVGILEPQYNEKEKHECVNFIKYNERYQVTPLSWWFRESFKCVDCGKDYKD